MGIKRIIRNKNYCYTEYDSGYCEEFKYDDNGNLIGRYIDGELCNIYKYDEENNKIYECFISENDSFEAWYEYDERGNLIHELNTNGYESWCEYDNQDHEICCYDINTDNTIISNI